ncbi:lysophospholipid acyltransferase family protein [Sphingomonas sp.]|uniref:lysophospholipid acyltransferase family protein n=1 Tax=Sphingomonas sp. TaxID=28214 RepID=UPI0026002499|nr:lysophospholipid acyltransferase family protein [Sphingomonas sp.]MBV9526980.1 1-acyl-sn-glycerol-3-phosphate acyltransferase [Sphingomonas sp.]
MAVLRSLLFAAIFYPATALWVMAGIVATLFGRRPTLAVVLSWVGLFHWLARNVVGIRVSVEGTMPPDACLIAVKHQSMFETLEMVRLTRLPVIVLKRELADIPLFGWMTRRYGVIPVDRKAGAKALRELVAEGKAAAATGRPILIFPEGTRVAVGHAPPLQSGFAALYRAVGLPVVPVAVDSGRLWGRGLVKRPGVITFRVADAIPAGLKRDEIEVQVRAAINALDSTSQASA